MQKNNKDEFAALDLHTPKSSHDSDKESYWLFFPLSVWASSLILPIVLFWSLFYKTPKANATSQHFPNIISVPKPNLVPTRSNPSANIVPIKRASLSSVSVSSYSENSSFQNKFKQYSFKKDSLRIDSNPQEWVEASVPRFPASQDLAVQSFNPSKLPSLIQSASSSLIDTFFSGVFTHFLGKETPEMTKAKIEKLNAETVAIINQDRRKNEAHELLKESEKQKSTYHKELNAIKLQDKKNKSQYKQEKRKLCLKKFQQKADPAVYEKAKADTKADENIEKTAALSDKNSKKNILEIAFTADKRAKESAQKMQGLFHNDSERKTKLIEAQLARFQKKEDKS